MAKHFNAVNYKKKFLARSALLLIAALICFFMSSNLNANCGVKNNEEIIAVPAEERIEKKAVVQSFVSNRIKSKAETKKEIKSHDVSNSQNNKTQTKNIAESSQIKKCRTLPIMAIIVDDGGEQKELTDALAKLSLPLTWSIMPYCSYSDYAVSVAEVKNIPYLLHLPMQAEIDKDTSEYIIGVNMSTDEIKKVVSKAFDTMPKAIGINNHRGSLATANAKTMNAVLEEIKKRNKIFIDSSTSAKSIAYKTALEFKIPSAKNNYFIDNNKEISSISAAFMQAVKRADKLGSLIVICHFRPSTVKFLEELNSNKSNIPVKFVNISDYIRLKPNY